MAPHGSSTFWRSLGYAWAGLLYAVLHQRNMRIHLIAAILVSFVGASVKLGLTEKSLLLLCVTLVIFAELLNTSLEQLVNLVAPTFDERAKIAKDTAAAAVLVLASGAVVIFTAIVVYDAGIIFADLRVIQRQVLVGVPFTLLCATLMHDVPTRPAWVDGVITTAALGFLGVSLTWSVSIVFSCLSIALLLVCVGGARERRRMERLAAPASAETPHRQKISSGG